MTKWQKIAFCLSALPLDVTVIAALAHEELKWNVPGKNDTVPVEQHQQMSLWLMRRLFLILPIFFGDVRSNQLAKINTAEAKSIRTLIFEARAIMKDEDAVTINGVECVGIEELRRHFTELQPKKQLSVQLACLAMNVATGVFQDGVEAHEYFEKGLVQIKLFKGLDSYYRQARNDFITERKKLIAPGIAEIQEVDRVEDGEANFRKGKLTMIDR